MLAASLAELCYDIQFVYTLSVNTTKFATKRIAVDFLIYLTIVWPPLED